MNNTYSRFAGKQPKAEEIKPQGNRPDLRRDEKGGVKINGHQQVLEMLRVADPVFRENLLRQIEKQDPALGRRLRAGL